VDELNLKSLDDLLRDPLFEELESGANRFNIFEALGAVRQELRHSDFLAFLLDPQRPHRLGDLFAKRLLQSAIRNKDNSAIPFNSVELDIWSLGELEVRREWQNIDILLRDERHQLLVPIENKVDTEEHSDQLRRYWDAVSSSEPMSWKKIGLYITPGGDPPSSTNYLSVDYAQISDVLEGVLKTRGSLLDDEVRTLIQHYIQMLGRHIMNDSEVASLCQQIYRKHKQALDLIYEHLPDRQAMIQALLAELINETEAVVLDSSKKRYIRFAAKSWESMPLKQDDRSWSSDGRVLLFEFQNQTDSLKLKLIIGPGPKDLRQKLLDMAALQRKCFKPAADVLNNFWNVIYSRPILSKEDEKLEDSEVKDKLRKQWLAFLDAEFKEICAHVQSLNSSA